MAYSRAEISGLVFKMVQPAVRHLSTYIKLFVLKKKKKWKSYFRLQWRYWRYIGYIIKDIPLKIVIDCCHLMKKIWYEV